MYYQPMYYQPTQVFISPVDQPLQKRGSVEVEGDVGKPGKNVIFEVPQRVREIPHFRVTGHFQLLPAPLG